jgi:hypothetical protein
MTDMLVFNPKNKGLDIHTKDLKACSGYSPPKLYDGLRILMRVWKKKDTEWSTDLYIDWREGYLPIMPVFLARFKDD